MIEKERTVRSFRFSGSGACKRSTGTACSRTRSCMACQWSPWSRGEPLFHELVTRSLEAEQCTCPR